VRRRVLRDSGALAVGSAVSGILAYVFFSISTRSLGPADAAPISVLWTYWGIGAAVLTFPLQHWIARAVAADQGEGGVRHALGGVTGIVVGCAVVTGLLAWLGRDRLFHRDDLVFPATVAVVTIGSGFVGHVRGVLTARRRFGAVAASMVGENGLRSLLAAALAVAGVDDPPAYAAALVAGQLVGLCWPSVLRVGTGGRRVADESPLAFLAGLGSGSLGGQLVLTGAPVLLAVRGGSAPEVTALFVTLALFRAPYMLSLGIVAQVTGRLTELVTAGETTVLRRLRLAVTAGALTGAAVAAVAGGLAGPWLVRLVFGGDVHVDAGVAAAVAAGSVLAIANLLLTLGLVARGLGNPVLRSWLVATAAGALWLTTDAWDPLPITVAVFVTAEAAAFLAMLYAESRAASRSPAR
jgi:O-antigen/teichoic acid export membrane protein